MPPDERCDGTGELPHAMTGFGGSPFGPYRKCPGCPVCQPQEDTWEELRADEIVSRSSGVICDRVARLIVERIITEAVDVSEAVRLAEERGRREGRRLERQRWMEEADRVIAECDQDGEGDG